MVEHVAYHIESKIFKSFILNEQKHLFLSEIIKKRIYYLKNCRTYDRLVVASVTRISSINKMERHYINEIMLKVVFSTITPKPLKKLWES